jgi:hypothetical protein
MGTIRNAYNILVGKPERKRQYSFNMKTDFKETIWACELDSYSSK